MLLKESRGAKRDLCLLDARESHQGGRLTNSHNDRGGRCMNTYLVIAVVWGVVVAATGAFLTDSRSAWYREVLKKPSWQPPDWAFGPAWSVIFALAGGSLYGGRRGGPNEDTR